jgi:hypothetical protein
VGPVILEVPAKFIRNMLPFFAGLSAMKDQAEALQVELRHPRNAHLH